MRDNEAGTIFVDRAVHLNRALEAEFLENIVGRAFAPER